MPKKLSQFIKPLLKSLVVIGLILTLVLGHSDNALAARAGGRMGGGSFRAPSRPYSPPTRTYRGPSGGGYYPGGGFGFPFIMPIFGFGGGGLFSIFLIIIVANFLVRTFQSAREEYTVERQSNPPVAIARLQIGLLAEARGLQEDLNRIAQTADTSSSAGLTQLLQETTLSLLRHPEYWMYAATESKQSRLESAELEFNRLALSERSKFTAETVSNVNNQLKQASVKANLQSTGELTSEMAGESGEYIIATVLVGAQGKLNLPDVNDSQDLRRALSQIGSIPSEQLLAVEVLWTPQASGESLTADEVIAEYPDLKLV
ncbi:MAG: DUF1517 domain-containing protein [Leptolyngbyaceae cyanobacterium MO_188.B28]|nr:DUF1517 domain-containing protein [Leptolyngbyaceae cyanobacterium MO_188.B28]